MDNENEEGIIRNNNVSGKGGIFSRQRSSRWTPTSDQIKILKELYYKNGIRSPNADQIQTISSNLTKYGKIQPKNVFYWFQNHKARQRHQNIFNIIPLPKHHQSSPSSSSSIMIGHMGNRSLTFEKSFKECSILSGGSSSVVGSRSHHTGQWIGVDPCTSPRAASKVFEKTKYVEEFIEDDDQEIETLPLFPIHGDRNLETCCHTKPEHSNGYYTTTCCSGSNDEAARSRTSLELSLSSYATISSDDAI